MKSTNIEKYKNYLLVEIYMRTWFYVEGNSISSSFGLDNLMVDGVHAMEH